jgi:hypothetical protein
MQKKQNTRRSLAECVHKIYRAGIFVNAGFIVGFDSEKGSVAEAMIDCIEATAIPFCTVGLLYALAGTQLTRRLAREGRLFDPDEVIRRNKQESADDHALAGPNFATSRPRRDILSDYRTILARVYHPVAYFRRVRLMARLLDRPILDRGASRDPPQGRRFGIPERDLRELRRLVWRMTLDQPRALWPLFQTIADCARHKRRNLGWVGLLAAMYLHLGPFARLVIASLDRQIADIDAGRWQQPATATPEPPKLVPERMPRDASPVSARVSARATL